jgi:hypothetical protein
VATGIKNILTAQETWIRRPSTTGMKWRDRAPGAPQQTTKEEKVKIHIK